MLSNLFARLITGFFTKFPNFNQKTDTHQATLFCNDMAEVHCLNWEAEGKLYQEIMITAEMRKVTKTEITHRQAIGAY